MICILLLLSTLTCCVCGLEVNVAHSSYQAEEKQSLTLEWTFTPKPDPSLKRLFLFCDFFTESKVSVLLLLHEGVEISESQSEEFSGRVQCDKDVLREGRIRLHVSSLRTEDSGWYICNVETDAGRDSHRSHLTVSAVRSPVVSEDEPEALKVETWGWTDVVSKGGMITGLAAVLVALYLLIIHPHLPKKNQRNQVLALQIVIVTQSGNYEAAQPSAGPEWDSISALEFHASERPTSDHDLSYENNVITTYN